MDSTTETLLGLFTEVAILEHLVRMREEHHAGHNLSTGDFGLLNYFVLNHPYPDSVAGIAWCFQEDEAYTRGKIDSLAAQGLLTLAPDVSDNTKALAMISEAGRESHTRVVTQMAPVIRSAVAEILPENLEITFRTLREIRLTLDNLPDR
jgi:DNA-binding MarR family transcriptional regulator